jgi:hypothetical protein
LALLGATFLVGASAFSAANAADVYEKGGSLKDGPVDYRPAISWAGFYAGVNAGGVFSDSIDLSASDGEESGSGDFDVDNTFLVGVHVGYNWQTARNVVLGVEGDISLLGGERDVEFDGEKLGEQDDNWLAAASSTSSARIGAWAWKASTMPSRTTPPSRALIWTMTVTSLRLRRA